MKGNQMSTKQIPLTKGQVALVDEADHDFLLHVGRWSFSKNGYAVHYYADEQGSRKTLYMHRLVMERKLGYMLPAGYQVDHRSRVTEGEKARLDNRRDNLRLATRTQNQANKGRQINTSDYKGVSRNHGTWEARIRYENRRLHLGNFPASILAALMYDAASRHLYGEFAGCNFPDTPTPPCVESRLRTVLKRYRLA
jgi:hypothetical protein